MAAADRKRLSKPSYSWLFDNRLLPRQPSLVAPELLDAEVLSVLRRAVLTGRLGEARAEMAVADLARWPVDRISHRTLVAMAWQYYRNVSTYAAFYVAAARSHGIPLMTADGRLSRAPNLGIVVQHVRMR